MTAVLVSAVLDLLRSDGMLTVHDGKPPDGGRPPYVVVYADPGLRSRGRIVAVSNEALMRFWTHSVAGSPAAARAVAGHVHSLLLDARLVVAGWNPSPIDHENTAPARTDPDFGLDVVDVIDTWRLYATPA